MIILHQKNVTLVSVNPIFSSSPYAFVPNLELCPHFVKLWVVFWGLPSPGAKMLAFSCFKS